MFNIYFRRARKVVLGAGLVGGLVAAGWACRVAIAQDAPPSPDGADATLITVHKSHVRFSEALAAVISQANDVFGEGKSAQDVLVSIDADRQPYWRVMELLTSQANFGIGIEPTNFTFNKIDSKTGGMSCIDRAFRITAQEIDHTFDYAADPGQRDVAEMPAMVMCEPRLYMIAATPAVIPVEAVDGKRQSLIPAQVHRSAAFQDSSPFCGKFKVQLAIPPGAGGTIPHLRGELNVLIDDAANLEIIPLPAHGGTFSHTWYNVPFQIRTISVPGNFQVLITATKDPTWAQDTWDRVCTIMSTSRIWQDDPVAQKLSGIEWLSVNANNTDSEFSLALQPAFKLDMPSVVLLVLIQA